jgi:hypothetical protein
MVFTVSRLLTEFVCLYNYEFWLSLCKIVRSSVILLLPLFPVISNLDSPVKLYLINLIAVDIIDKLLWLIWTFLIQNNTCFIKKHAFTYTRSINRTLKIPEYVMILVTSLWIQPKCDTIYLTEKSSSVFNYRKCFFEILI